MNYETDGTIHKIFDTQSFESGFTKREFVVTTDEKYPQQLKLELIKDRCDLLDAYKVGDRVVVNFNLRGNEYNDKYYVNLQAWALKKLDMKPNSSVELQPEPDVLDGEDLPF